MTKPAPQGLLRIREALPAWQGWLLGILPIAALLGVWMLVQVPAGTFFQALPW